MYIVPTRYFYNTLRIFNKPRLILKYAVENIIYFPSNFNNIIINCKFIPI